MKAINDAGTCVTTAYLTVLRKYYTCVVLPKAWNTWCFSIKFWGVLYSIYPNIYNLNSWLGNSFKTCVETIIPWCEYCSAYLSVM